MQKSDLITIRPAVKQKGFRSEQLKIVPATSKDLEVQGKLGGLFSNSQYLDMPAERRRIIDLVVESYRRKTEGEPLEPQHYVLSGHELVEFDRLEEQDVLRYMFYRYKYNKYPELKIVDDYPPCVQIEPSSICNYRCIMCYQVDESFSGKGSEHMGYMPLDTFKAVVDEAEGNIEAITLASRGEPLLNRAVVDMLEYCRGKFLGLKVNTNASVLTEKMVHALLSSDVQTIVFSIDAADRELYERIRVRGKFDRVIKNLERFREIKEKHYSDSETITRISGVKINDSQDIESMERMWSGYADIVAFTNYTPWESSYENAVNDIESPCTELWRRTFVWQDGAVNPCDYDYKSMLSRWNVRDMSVSDIWTSEEYEDLRRRHLEKLRSTLEPCRRCISV